MDPNLLIDVSILSLLVFMAILVAVTNNLLNATIFLAIYSLLMAIMYLTMGAPDVAITEAAIGAGISTILFIAVIILTGEKESKHKKSYLALVVIALTTTALIYATLGLPDFGSATSVANLHVAPHYLEKSYEETGITNVVTSILASYRGYDTLGETFVIFTAGISLLLLLGKDKI